MQNGIINFILRKIWRALDLLPVYFPLSSKFQCSFLMLTWFNLRSFYFFIILNLIVHYRVIVFASVITKSNWNFSSIIMLFFVKSSHWFCSVSVNFNWSIIYFWKCLQFNIITPNSILPFPVYILLEVIFTSYDELNKEISFTLDIVHTMLPY